MIKRSLRKAVLSGACLLTILLLAAFVQGQPVRQTTVLYDGSLGGTPDNQGFTYAAFAASATQSYAAGVTTLNTMPTIDDQAGYFGQDLPPLDQQEGYSVQFSIQIAEEFHEVRSRAGFSMTVLSSDLQGIELGFWTNQIWAQEGGVDSLFRRAEKVDFDTTAALTAYELHIAGGTYTLTADGSEILSGPLRDYTAFEGLLDPYETPNLLFFGDNTSRGQARVDIATIAIQTAAAAMSTPAPTATLDSTPKPGSTSPPISSATPTVTITLIPHATRSWNWWFPLTAGYPANYQ